MVLNGALLPLSALSSQYLLAEPLQSCCLSWPFLVLPPLFLSLETRVHLTTLSSAPAAFFYFSTAFFGASVILNVIFLYRPVLGLPKR